MKWNMLLMKWTCSSWNGNMLLMECYVLTTWLKLMLITWAHAVSIVNTSTATRKQHISRASYMYACDGCFTNTQCPFNVLNFHSMPLTFIYWVMYVTGKLSLSCPLWWLSAHTRPQTPLTTCGSHHSSLAPSKQLHHLCSAEGTQWTWRPTSSPCQHTQGPTCKQWQA